MNNNNRSKITGSVVQTNTNRFIFKYDYENHIYCGELTANMVMSSVNNVNNSSIREHKLDSNSIKNNGWGGGNVSIVNKRNKKYIFVMIRLTSR